MHSELQTSTDNYNLIPRVSLSPPPREREKGGGERETLGTRLGQLGHLQRVLFCSLKCCVQFINGVSVIRLNCKKRTRKTCFDGLALGLLCIGLPEPIERNPFNCVRLSSVSEPNRTQSDGLSSIEFDLFGNRTH